MKKKIVAMCKKKNLKLVILVYLNLNIYCLFIFVIKITNIFFKNDLL